MKIYNYSYDYGWDTCRALAVFANSREEADKFYRAQLKADDAAEFDGEGKFKCEEVEIVNGLLAVPYGYDACELSFKAWDEGINVSE